MAYTELAGVVVVHVHVPRCVDYMLLSAVECIELRSALARHHLGAYIAAVAAVVEVAEVAALSFVEIGDIACSLLALGGWIAKLVEEVEVERPGRWRRGVVAALPSCVEVVLDDEILVPACMRVLLYCLGEQYMLLCKVEVFNKMRRRWRF